MKILYITDILTKMGGAERNLLQLAVGFKKRGFEPKVFCLKGGPLKYTLLKQGIEAVDLQMKRIYDLAGLKTIVRMVKFIKKRNIDLIVTYHVDSDFLGLILSKLCRIPIISSRRDMGFHLKKRHILAYKVLNNLFDSIAAVSHAVREAIVKTQNADPRKIRVIYNGLDPSQFVIHTDVSQAKKELGLNRGYPIVGCVANLRAVKGHRYLIEAAETILGEIPEVQFLLVGLHDTTGTDEYYQEINEQVKEIGIKKSCIFAGKRDDIPEILSMIDISVIPSLSEGFSNTILESMAAGKPVVATNIGGNPEAVVDRKTGILVPPADSLALAKAITYLLKDRSLSKQMGEEGKKRVAAEFNLERLLTATKEYYECTIETHLSKKRLWFFNKWLRTKKFLINGIKISLSGILYYSGIIKTYLWARKVLGKSIVKILAYHNISDRYPTYLGISLPIMDFENQIKWLRDNFHIIPLQEAAEMFNKRKRITNAVALTFDDCYKEFYSTIFPIAEKYGIPATFFLTVGPIQSGIPLAVDLIICAIANTEKGFLDMTSFGLNRYLLNTYWQKEEAIYEINEYIKRIGTEKGQEVIKEMHTRLGLDLDDVKKLDIILNWEDVKKMRNNRITLGSHTLTHPDLAAISGKEAEKEIKRSKAVLEEKIGTRVSFFAYPYGGKNNINDTAINLVKSAGFLAAVTLIRHAPNNASPFLLPRLSLAPSVSAGPRGNFSKSLFAMEMSGLSDYLFLRFIRGGGKRQKNHPYHTMA